MAHRIQIKQNSSFQALVSGKHMYNVCTLCYFTAMLTMDLSFQVFEETGFDISPLINTDDYIEYKMNEQLSRLYIVPHVSMETKFHPKTRKEIKVNLFKTFVGYLEMF